MSVSTSNNVIFYDRYFLKTLFSIPKFKLSHPPKNPAVMPTAILPVNGMANRLSVWNNIELVFYLRDDRNGLGYGSYKFIRNTLNLIHIHCY
jgi:hypothetical protein